MQRVVLYYDDVPDGELTGAYVLQLKTRDHPKVDKSAIREKILTKDERLCGSCQEANKRSDSYLAG